MKVISPEALYQYNYYVDVLNALRQYWTESRIFSCIGFPKKKNMLLYIDGCRAKYTLKNGEVIIADDKSTVYTPINYEYIVEFFDFKKGGNTIGINFFLHDNEDFILSDKIEIFNLKNPEIPLLFNKLERLSAPLYPSPSRMKATFYEIMSILSEQNRLENLSADRFSIISQGILYLENSDNPELSVTEIASMCGVSEIYFRRLFTEYAGVGPVAYKLNSKITKAKSLLKYSDVTVAELAEQLGFIDSSYFIRQFKAKTGKTPLQYRKGGKRE